MELDLEYTGFEERTFAIVISKWLLEDTAQEVMRDYLDRDIRGRLEEEGLKLINIRYVHSRNYIYDSVLIQAEADCYRGT